MTNFRKIFSLVSIAIACVGLLYVCVFKIVDLDFWWHVKAGEIMMETHELIHTDPFAYTREGLPYISTHEWLAQIIFYNVWNAGGAVGEITFRSILVAIAFLGILLIDRKTAWPNFFILLLAAYFNRPSFMDRPQLFSFVFFACFLYSAFYYLRRSHKDTDTNGAWRNWLIAILACVQVLWVNIHGAAAVYGMIVIAGLFAQRVFEWFGSADRKSRNASSGELKYLGFLLFCLVGSAFISPNTWHTFQDVFVYTSDQTLAMVREWQPRGVHGYATEVAPFLLLVIVSIGAGRRHLVFSAFLALVMGYLSFQSYRHGIFFIFSALAISVYQGRYMRKYQDWISQWARKPLWAGGASIALLLVMMWYMQYRNISELQREGYSGYGSFSQAQDAYPFLEKAKISGRMFNTYSIGDYLLYRGYPDRKVYIDGRNIDYGYDFLYKTGLAGFNPDVWNELEKKYNFTYAVIDYPLAPGASVENDLPYVAHLNFNKNWTLVYLDDWIAIYVKNTKENETVIKEYGYSAITPESIEFGSAFQKDMSEDEIKKVEQELERATKHSARSIKARLTLAHHYVDTKEYEKAQAFANDAISAQPHRPEVYEALGLVAVGTQNYRDAGALFEQSIKLTGGVGPSIDYAYLASIFSKAGDISKASYYHQKAK